MLRSSPLDVPDREPITSSLAALRAGLRDQKYVEGVDFTIDYRLPRTDADVVAQADAVVALNVDVIHAAGPLAVQAATRATTTIPIVAHDYETNPVASGLVISLARPGRNVTGMFLDLPELNGKFLELLQAVVPRMSRVTALWDASTGRTQVSAAEEAARTLGVTLQVVEIREDHLDESVRVARHQRAQALLVLSSPMVGAHVDTIAQAAMRSRLPSISLFRHYASAGCLMSYGPLATEIYRQEGRQIGKLLAGAKVSELPVERPTKFELVINTRTATALGLSIPQSVLLRADDVIR